MTKELDNLFTMPEADIETSIEMVEIEAEEINPNI